MYKSSLPEIMKVILPTTGIILFSLCISAGAQPLGVTTLTDISDFMQSNYNYNREYRASSAMIEGSPYLSEEFVAGSLSYRDSYYRDLQLRYNVYDGHFEFKSEDEILYFDPRYTEVDTVWIGNDTYIFQEYIEARNVKRSYMQLLYDSDGIQAFKQYEIILLEPEPPRGYEDAKPARFQQRPERLFVRFKGDPAQEFPGRKSIPELFPAYADELITYTKKDRLRFRKPEDLVLLCKYYNSLMQ